MDQAHQAPNKWCLSLNCWQPSQSSEGGTNEAEGRKEEQ